MSLPFIKAVDSIIDPNEIILTKGLIKDKLIHRANQMVKTVKDTISSQWAAPVLLSLVLGYNIYDSQKTSSAMNLQAAQMQEQHDLLIKLQTQKEEQEKQHERDRQDAIREADLQRVWRETMTNKMNNLEFVVKNVKG